MTKITTLKKASRGEAYSIVSTLHSGGDVSQEKLDELLNYFAPAVPPVAKTAFDWLSKACAVPGRDLREALHVVHVKNGKATACNGHCIFWGDVDMADGQYAPKTQKALETPHPNVPAFDRDWET